MLQTLSYAELFLEDKLPACIRFFLEKWREPAQKRINIVFENWTSIDGLVYFTVSQVFVQQLSPLLTGLLKMMSAC